MIKNPPASERDMGLIPGLGRSLGEGNDNPLQHSYLENPTDRGAWSASVYGVAQSWTRLTQLHMHTLDNILKLAKEKGADFLKKMQIQLCHEQLIYLILSFLESRNKWK